MVSSAIKRALIKRGYYSKNRNLLLTQTRDELDLTNYSEVEKWFKNKKPKIVIIAAAKVGGIYANKT